MNAEPDPGFAKAGKMPFGRHPLWQFFLFRDTSTRFRKAPEAAQVLPGNFVRMAWAVAR